SYAVGISSDVTAFLGTPRFVWRSVRGPGRPRTRPELAANVHALSAAALAEKQRSWRVISWRNRRDGRQWMAEVTALRVTPARDWKRRRLLPEIWLLCERHLVGDAFERKFHFVNLPPTASLHAIVKLAHQRWAIEQQYQELKTELGLDHFEGRTFPGWHHHVVLTAIAHAYIQRERRRRGAAGLTFPAVRAIVQEIFTALLFAQKPRYMHWMEQAKRELQLRI